MFTRKQIVINEILSKRNSYFVIATCVLLLLVSFACKKSSPTSSNQIETKIDTSLFILGKGVQVTFDNDAGSIAWISDSTNIAYTSLILQYGQMSNGTIKAINIRNKEITILDSTLRHSNWFSAIRDSLFNLALNQDNSKVFYIISNCILKPIISTVPYPLLLDEFIITVSPDSKRILLTSGRILNLSDGTSTNVSLPTKSPYWINWNANGLQMLTFTQDSTQSYFVSDLLTGVSKKIWQSGNVDTPGYSVAWSLDGKKIAFLRTTSMIVSPTVHYLYLCDVASGSAQNILSVKVRIKDSMFPGIWTFAFSQNSKRLAYIVEGNIYYQDI